MPKAKPLRCGQCFKVIGVVYTPPGRAYCSERCLKDYPVSLNESRDDVITQLLAKGIPTKQIAETFNLTRQRITQMKPPVAHV